MADDDHYGKRCTVMGLGRFGGGIGVARWLAEQGALVTATDTATPQQLTAAASELDALINASRIRLRLGEHCLDDFTTAELVVANPAVPHPWSNPFLTAASDHGVPITTEIRLLIERLNRSRIIGITGSAGKSTTSAMIHHLLSAAGHAAHLGGNIGGSMLNALDSIADDDWIVLELSSTMLYWLGAGVGFEGAPGWSPHVAVLTNIEPNHLDWHETFQHYEQSKHNIFRHQAPDDLAFRCDDVELTGTPLPLSIPGEHNQRNARLALTVVRQLVHLSETDAAESLRSFRGLPHRLELVGEFDGIRFYNDSKSTTPRATVLAVSAFDNPARVHLIAGGYDKKIDLTDIADLGSMVAGLYTIGTTGETLAKAGGPRAIYCETIERAFETAMASVSAGDVMLLSPGCASWDQFDNFEARGDRFRALVGAITAQPARSTHSPNDIPAAAPIAQDRSRSSAPAADR